MNIMSNTPRTDDRLSTGLCSDLALAAFTRSLERELNAEKAQTQRLREALELLKNQHALHSTFEESGSLPDWAINSIDSALAPPAGNVNEVDLGFDPSLTREQLHAQWKAKYQQVMELWNADNCRNNETIERLQSCVPRSDIEPLLAALEKAGWYVDGQEALKAFTEKYNRHEPH